MSTLDPRKQTILRAVVLEYVAGAEPVGSELLASRYGLGVKSATVRSELAELADLGFLEQPHTSAGRIPSDAGYRYFVDELVVLRPIDDEAKQSLRDASQSGDALQSLLRDTARALSRFTQLLVVATTLRDAGVGVRRVVVSALGPTQALLVLILNNGAVENRMLECPPGLTLEQVAHINESVNRAVAGKPLRTLRRLKTPATSGVTSEDRFAQNVCSALRALARELTKGVAVSEGEQFMIAQPEFQRDLSALKEVLRVVEDADALGDVAPADGVNVVTIGKENQQEALYPVSIVRDSFFVGESEAGFIAVVGPTRMRYEMSIPLVTQTARALSESLTRHFGR